MEQKFKATDRRPWDPNLLSCTPTLEMGIDIGDLSSLILCSERPLLEVLELALELMRSCACNRDPGRDGCYRCLYAYRNSYELVDAQGEIVATAELGWEGLRVAFLREEERAYARSFEDAGWRAFPLVEAMADPESYIPLHRG
ncbi:MAG: hypothetical protein HYY20_04505 [Candidatus Tectomicrobia bacterium]|uniref:DUF1998 domain-containing protein n=1 Tax=Tectimicrobiota bacterium TaxID=2528274 RepID=A0A932CN21_UNCTE|nr:hypothetical protein [Candidatus Tectomicrobia bacterium]